MIDIPDSVVRMQLAVNGEHGRAWLAALPRLVDELRDLWRITELGPPFRGGCVGYVVPALLSNHTRAVLKLNLLDEETECEPDALALWNGHGAARLLESDRSRGALLLERVEPGTPLLDHADREGALDIACSLLKRLQIQLPRPHPFRFVTALARRYAETFPSGYQAAGRPFSEPFLHRAIEISHHFAQYDGPQILANRDFHLGNILSAQREPWLAIDPKPLAGEPAFDAAHLIRSLLPDPFSVDAFQGLTSSIARRLELPLPRIAAWVFVRSIENALWSVSAGDADIRWDIACAGAAQPFCHLL